MRNAIRVRNDWPMGNFWQETDRLFDQFFRPAVLKEELFRPLVDIDESEAGYLLSFDLPGLKKEEINVEVKEGLLTVSGERKRETKNSEGGLTRVEKTYGQFQRSFNLPTNVDSERVEANLENGVLHLLIPKAEASRSKSVKIEDGGGSWFQKVLGKTEEN